jgi:hypothetical protein
LYFVGGMGCVAIESVLGSAHEMEVASNKLSNRFEEVEDKVLELSNFGNYHAKRSNVLEVYALCM